MDIYDGENNFFERRLLPMVALQRCFLDAGGKLIALLWQLWLMTGPEPEQLRRLLASTRAIVTDCGVERLLADTMDIVPDFFQTLGLKGRLPERTQHTFPRALAIPGWMHSWDTILRRGLASLPWFPSWLEGFRACVAFFVLPLTGPRLSRTSPNLVTQLWQR